MSPARRNWIVVTFLSALVAAAAWALSSPALEPADFTFVNNTEIQSIDPSIATGQPECRVIMCLFEGLTDWDPKDLHPIPGVADHWEISDDLRTYTFHLRENAKWTDGSPVTAGDFVWQWRRMLDPATVSEYVYQLWYLENGERYTNKDFKPGEPVEIELNEHVPGSLPFARGKVLHGRLVETIDMSPSSSTAGADVKNEKKPEPVYLVDIDGTKRLFVNVKPRDLAKWSPSELPAAAIDKLKNEFTAGKGPATTIPQVESCKAVLLDFSEVGAKEVDDHTLRVTLKAATPFFLQLSSYYPLYPTNPRCLETYGYPAWTKPENVVTNGAFKLQSRVVRSRIRMVKNPNYWNAEKVKLNTVDVLPIEASSTALNLYMNGQVDWIPLVPTTSVPDLLQRKRTDFLHTPEFTTDFYRINCTKPPLNNKLVRQALAMSVDKRQIVEGVIRGGEVLARSCVPPGIAGYEPALCPEFNPQRARELLAEAGYPDGRGIPKIEIIYNTDELNQSIAEVIQSQWKENLGIDVGLQNMEWNAWLAASNNLKYQVARAGWIGDYLDPNTFLDMWLTDGGNNQTGWSSEQYDKLIAQAAAERNPEQRMQILHQAEVILMDEMPILPLYYRISRNMVRPYVKGFYPTLLDLHPLEAVWIDEAEKRKFQVQGGRG